MRERRGRDKEKYRAYQRKYHRAYRAKRRAEEKCVVCGNSSKTSRCPGCSEFASLKRRLQA